jgi:hypothetical protein
VPLPELPPPVPTIELAQDRRFTIARGSLIVCAALATAAGVMGQGREPLLSTRAADSFARKVLEIQQYARAPLPGARLTPVTEAELNSYLRLAVADRFPDGVRDPYIAIVGNGRVTGRALVDLDAVGRARRSPSLADVATLLAGQFEITVVGTLRSEDGLARFDLESASAGGVPVPKGLVQDLVRYYSRSPEFPSGVNLDDPVALPARIQEIHVREGQAVVVQR